MTATLNLIAALSAEATLKYRAAMSELIEPSIESADPKAQQVPKIAHRDTFRVADDEFDQLQNDAESDFIQDMVEGMQHRSGRSARQAW